MSIRYGGSNQGKPFWARTVPRCASVAADDRNELYKVTVKYGNPETREPHGFPIDKTQKEVKEMFQKTIGN